MPPYDAPLDREDEALLLSDEQLRALAFDDEPVDALDDPDVLPLDALTDFAASQEWSS